MLEILSFLLLGLEFWIILVIRVNDKCLHNLNLKYFIQLTYALCWVSILLGHELRCALP